MSEVSFLTKVIRFFKPYYNPRPKKVKIKHDPSQQQEQKDDLTSIKILKSKQKLETVWATGHRPKHGQYWFYHDATRHEICAFLPKGTAFLHKGRDDERRAELKPMLYPKADKAYDRTHLIPYGYHGSENNPALVVGWDSDQNRKDLREFEIKVNNINKSKAIYWFTLLERRPTHATWEYRIFDAESGKLLDKLDLKLECKDWSWEI